MIATIDFETTGLKAGEGFLRGCKSNLVLLQKNGRGHRKEKGEMLIGGKEYKTGQRIKVINAKSILHYK